MYRFFVLIVMILLPLKAAAAESETTYYHPLDCRDLWMSVVTEDSNKPFTEVPICGVYDGEDNWFSRYAASHWSWEADTKKGFLTVDGPRKILNFGISLDLWQKMANYFRYKRIDGSEIEQERIKGYLNYFGIISESDLEENEDDNSPKIQLDPLGNTVWVRVLHEKIGQPIDLPLIVKKPIKVPLTNIAAKGEGFVTYHLPFTYEQWQRIQDYLITKKITGNKKIQEETILDLESLGVSIELLSTLPFKLLKIPFGNGNLKFTLVTVTLKNGKTIKVLQSMMTNEEYIALMNLSSPSRFKDQLQNPVDSVFVRDLPNILLALNKLGHGHFRWPTNSEFDVLAEGGEPNWWKDQDKLEARAWHKGNSHTAHPKHYEGRGSQPVKQKDPNGFGLYDIFHLWHITTADNDPNKYFFRGAGWCNDAANVKLGYSYEVALVFRNRNVGLRFVSEDAF